MRLHLRLTVPLLIAAAAALAISSAQGARPPAAQLSFSPASYTFDAISSGGRMSAFDLRFTGKGNTGPLSTSLALDAGSSGLTITADTCNGKTLNAKTRECTIEVTYAWHAPVGTDTAVLSASGRSLSAQASITGVSAATKPTVGNQSVITSLNTAKTITLSSEDLDGDANTFSIFVSPEHGTLGEISTAACSGTPWTCTATVTYTPNTDYTGYDQFAYVASDGAFISEWMGYVGITVTPSTDDYSPWANSFFTDYTPGESKTITLTGGDPNGDEITFEIYGDPLYGTLSDMGVPYCSVDTPSICEVEVTYTPNPGFDGSDSFTYRTFDGENSSNVATVSLGLS